MADLIDRDALLKDMGLTDAVKYGNKTAEQQYRSYSTWMSYEIADAIWDAPAVNRWIPCSERLPHGGRVLATTKQGYVVDVIFVAKGSQWFRNGECFSTDTVIAWMPMPDAYEPPKEAEKDDEKEEKP